MEFFRLHFKIMKLEFLRTLEVKYVYTSKANDRNEMRQ